MADNLLDKASILLTPTAYDNGSMLSIKPENGDGDFDFQRNSAATRVNAQGLVENVQIISSELVSNGNFSQIGTEEVLNGNFSQEGSELITNGDFATDSGWAKGSGWIIENGKATHIGGSSNSYINQTNRTVVGKNYKAVFTFSGGLNSSNHIMVYGVGLYADFFEYTSDGTYTLYFTADATFFRFRAINPDNDVSIDNVSVKEVGQNWSLGGDVYIDDSLAHFESNSNTYSFIRQDISSLTSKQYKIQVEVKNYVSGAVQVGFSGSIINLNVTTDGVYTAYTSPNTSGLLFEVSREFNGGNFNFDITNISVKEVGQDWTFGGGWSMGDGVSESDSTPSSYLGQEGVILTTNLYRLTFQARLKTGTNGTVTALIGGSNSNQFTIADTNWQTFTYENTRLPSSQTGIYFNNDGNEIEIDNVSVKEITDDTNIPRINYEGFSYQDSLGSELIVNGGFDTDSNWNKQNGATISNGAANFPVSNSKISQSISSATIDKVYRVEFNSSVINLSNTAVLIYGDGFYGLSNIPSLGKNILYITTNISGGSQINTFQISGGANGSIDNVSVKEVTEQEVVPDSGCGSWLLEPQSTNLLPYSSDFSQWNFGIGITVESGYLAPDGTNSAYRVSGSVGALSFAANATQTQTRTIYAKTVSGTGQAHLCSYFGNTNNLFTITDQWQRFEVNGTTTPTGSVTFYGMDFRGSTNLSEIIIWGAQLENQSYATSYIPTNGAANTRLQDIANNSGNSSLINSTEGVLYAEIAALVNAGTGRAISLFEDNNNTVSLFYFSATNTIRALSLNNGSTQAQIDFVLSDATDFNKIAFKYKENDCALWVNGIEVGTDVNSTIPTALNSLNFDYVSNLFFGKTKALVVYKEALTDANLRSLTYPNPVATTFDLDFDTIAEQFTFTRGSEATFVNAQGLIESTASNDAPRIDYSTGAKAFLLEPQSTNLITQSELFSDSSWTKLGVGTGNVAIVTDNYAISPDGTQNASRLQCDLNGGVTSSGNQSLIADSYYSSGNQTISVYLKSNNGQNQTIYFANTQTSGDTVTITSEWQRFEFSYNTSSTYVFAVGLRGRSGGAIDDTADILIWAAQAENQSYATSYIPTSGASATRNQELCNNATPVINSEEGTLYFEGSLLANDGTYKQLTLNAGSPDNSIRLMYTDIDNQVRYFVRRSASTQADITHTLLDATEFSKIAMVYKTNDFQLWVNGIKVGTDTSGTPPSGLNIIDFNDGSTSSPFFGNTKGLKYYPKALADVQLEDLTTI